MIHHYLLKLSICVAFIFLVSCAGVEKKSVEEKILTEPAGWVLEQQKRQQINSWEIRGRLGIQTENNGGTLEIIWKQSEQEFTIRFIAPMGAGTYRIQGNDNYAEIRYPDGEKKVINNIDQIFSAALDIDLPTQAVKDWIRGLPAEALTVEDISWNNQGLLNTVKQSGWNVEMKKYTGEGVLFPHAIYLSRDDDDELSIRLLLRQWMID